MQSGPNCKKLVEGSAPKLLKTRTAFCGCSIFLRQMRFRQWADIVSPEGPAIYEQQADKLIITLAEGTENSLTDGSPVTDEDDTIGTALYAEDDLSINGQGTLTVNGTQKHGIQSKADLIIAGGAITVTAVTDGVRGRNSVLVLDGVLGITCGGDGITATRTDAEFDQQIVIVDAMQAVDTVAGCHLFAHTIAQPHRQLRIEGLSQFHFSSCQLNGSLL